VVAHKTYLRVRDDLPARPDVGGMEIEDDVDEEDDVDNRVDDEEAARHVEHGPSSSVGFTFVHVC
jgi:hypothetical protein